MGSRKVAKPMIICSGCQEPWDLASLSKEQFLELFNEDHKLELGFPLYEDRFDWGDVEANSYLWKNLKLDVIKRIVNEGCCFSCGFSRLYRVASAAELWVGCEIASLGTVTDIESDGIDPSVGIFDNSVMVYCRSRTGALREIEFGYHDLVVIVR